MAAIVLDDTDPIDEIVLAYREELRAAQARGNFYGETSSRVSWQAGKPGDDIVTTERRRKRVAKQSQHC